MDIYASDLIRPLHIAENQFLEILLSQFSLRRRNQGSELLVALDENMPAIWTRAAKYQVERMIPDFEGKASRYQKELDSFLLDSEGDTYEFNDADFRFRYVSGGALPVLRFGRKEYYCLFYRDIFPIGWNIANGGSDDINELLNPYDTLERELREELVVVDPKRGRRYVFEGDAGKPLDHYDFAVARRLWQRRLSSLDFSKLEELVIPLKWLDGPDYLTVEFANESRTLGIASRPDPASQAGPPCGRVPEESAS